MQLIPAEYHEESSKILYQPSESFRSVRLKSGSNFRFDLQTQEFHREEKKPVSHSSYREERHHFDISLGFQRILDYFVRKSDLLFTPMARARGNKERKIINLRDFFYVFNDVKRVNR